MSSSLKESGLFIVDADSHWSEPPDLFTRRAPEAYRDRVPRVADVDGTPMWIFDGKPVGRFSAAGVIGRDGRKEAADIALHHWTVDQVHVGAYDPQVRLGVLDECGIDAQIIFPSTIGLGGQDLGAASDPALTRLSVEIYNDAMAEIQSDSNNRLLPLPLMPAWDVDLCVREARRVHALGARGVNMTSDPQDLGAPDLANRAWDPFWEVCTELRLPVHFHIGASVTTMTFYGKYPWESHSSNTKLAIGGTLLFIGNARVVTNLILSGIFDRHPGLKTVSVESGVGWIPFILEALDYEMSENAPEELAALSKAPSEYFRSNIYATFWFEKNRNKLPALIEAVGEDNILFETDFPHPTCLYPNPLETVAPKLATLAPETRAKILGENARKLYRL
ncbi:Predicted metal-dependent hydrolase, TIM-barrel fold [Parafrankia irregularis]|uniref:Predicted metal-dependent hydrolase, TIM-barrel fold n=1 Tax=Parafrankia irregularis TaxID=795642 RepID=A0A0S4QGB7_9ACTN|nr:MULTISPECIES: amidohydrolase family protein [Parafrankia]MBE3201005.1 amidohydrolase [Parafrankia sp. CH37]CUU54597.1 Predicted metal-dependent hydrolase, TIM-barrel fold [Parafrankia irregularis]